MGSPFQLTPEQAARERSSFDKPSGIGATMWSSNLPGELYYSPTGSDWQMLNEQSYNDPTQLAAIQRGANTPSAAQSVYQDFLNKASPAAQASMQAATKAGEGSSHSLSPDVLAKMWR